MPVAGFLKSWVASAVPSSSNNNNNKMDLPMDLPMDPIEDQDWPLGQEMAGSKDPKPAAALKVPTAAACKGLAAVLPTWPLPDSG